MKIHHLTKSALRGAILDHSTFAQFEEARNKQPVVYNIETTNACNMRCEMCPRTTRMTRAVKTIDKNLFVKIVEQLNPFSEDLWEEWEKFVYSEYNIPKNTMSENHFFLYIIPKVIQLHGYGDPLLDKNMGEHIRLLSEKGFSSYFSCNPANINIDKTVEMFENGLNYIKYSIESTDDKLHKQVRGKASNFTESYDKICELLRAKEKHGYNTTIVITMLDLNRPSQKEDYKKLKHAFRNFDVYIYMKSEDQQWYRKDYHGTKSVHWSEICKHPWMSTTIKSNGDVAMCMEDYNNEIVLGNVQNENLYDIWNGEKYRKFRATHFDLTKNLKCVNECDMCLIGEFTR
jgi:radical SAM protein with 4Fe4S-binding SPASM domain